MSHVCANPRCNRRVPDHMLACREHWSELPGALRDRIWANYLPGQDVTTATPAYLEALTECIEFWTRA